jgi:O-Antigen ligase
MNSRSYIVVGVWFSGFLLGFYPPMSAAMIALMGFVHFVRQPRWQDRALESLLILWGLARVILSFRISGLPWIGFLEMLVIWLMFRGLFYITDQIRSFSVSAFFGLVIASGLALIGSWSLLGFDGKWVAVPKVSSLLQSGGIFVARPIQQKNSWLGTYVGLQGPGRLLFEFDARAKKQINLGIFTDEWNIPTNVQRVWPRCLIKTTWTHCKLWIDMPRRSVLNVSIGGSESWKLGDSSLELGIPRISIVTALPVWDRILSSPRAQGWAFNENAFGAWAAVVSLVVINVHPGFFWSIGAAALGLFGILLSGSRGALLAFFAGLGVVLFRIVYFRFRRFFVPALLVCGTAILLLVNTFSINEKIEVPSGFRAFSLNQPASGTSRLEIYNAAIRVFLQSPIIGVGDSPLAIYDVVSKVQSEKDTQKIHAHNFLLQSLSESGLIGLLLILAIWGIIILRSIHRVDFRSISILVAILLINTFDYLYLYSPIQICLWLAALSGRWRKYS